MVSRVSAVIGFIVGTSVAASAALSARAAVSRRPASSGGEFRHAQIDAGVLADIVDMRITSDYLDVQNVTEVSLGLATPSPDGAAGVTFLFKATFPGRTVDPNRLQGIVMRMHYRLHSDDRTRSARAIGESHELHMNLDPQDPVHVTLSFFPANWGYGGFAPPGDAIPVAYFDVSPQDLRALSKAKVVTGEGLWTDFSFRPDQLDAIQRFARQVLPAERRR